MRRAVLLASLALLGCNCTPEPTPEELKAQSTPEPAQKSVANEADDSGGPEYVVKGPERITDAKVGTQVADLPWAAVDGRKGKLSDLLRGKKALVVVLSTLGCPVTKNYSPLLKALAARCAERGAAFLVVDPALQDEDAEVQARSKRLGWTFPVIRDPAYGWCDGLGVKRTADAFVIDAKRTIRYRGPVDDQIGFNYRLAKPRNRYLEDALAAVLAGDEVAVPALAAPGCLVARIKLPD